MVSPVSQSQHHSPACCFSLVCVIPAPFCLVSKSISKGFLALTSVVFMVQQFWGQAIDPCTNKASKQMLKGFPGHPKLFFACKPWNHRKDSVPAQNSANSPSPSLVPRTSQEIPDSGTSRKCHRCGERSRKKQSLQCPRL